MARARPKKARTREWVRRALQHDANGLQSAAAAWLILASICAAQPPPLFNVKDYGAVGDGATIDTPAINNAIIAANAAGGGTVVFPAGNYLSVSIHLSNNVTLYLSNNAAILSATNGFDAAESNPWSAYQDYGHSHFHDALIWGENLTNIGFAGSGTISGNGSGGLTTGNPPAGQADKAISLKLCTNVVIRDITITRAGHFAILANGCSNMVVSGAKILNAESINHRDAFNLISSSFVVVTNCIIQGSDDAMVLKSDFALGQKITSQNIHIMNCQILSTENNALQFGSETIGDFHDVTWAHLQLGGAGKAGIGITSNDGSIIDGVTYDDITMSNCACPIFIKLSNQDRPSSDPHPVGRIRNISINNVVATHSTLFSRTNTSTINGWFDGTNTCIPIENITFNNVNVSNIGTQPASAATNNPPPTESWQPQNFGNWPSYGWYLRYARNISFTNCQTHFDINDDRPGVVVETCTNILFDSLKADVGAASPYDMRFTNTVNFQVTNSVSTSNAPLRLSLSNATPASIVLPPYFNPSDGIYAGTQMVVIASGTPGASIRYTTDGSTPSSTSGTVYSGPVAISSETVLLAIAYRGGMVDSAVNTAIYNYPGTSLLGPPPPAPLPSFGYEAESIPFTPVGAPAAIQNDASTSGGHWEALLATNAGPYIDYTITNVLAGTYDLAMLYKAHPNRGIITMSLDGVSVGGTLDQYSASPNYPSLDLGSFTFAANGNHIFRQTVVGKNPAAGAYTASADKFVLTLLQPPRPGFNSITSSVVGVIQLAGLGYPSLQYEILAEDDLRSNNWAPIGTSLVSTAGSLLFTDSDATNHPKRFYRLQFP